MKTGTLPNGAKGFDANRVIRSAQATEALAHGYAFVIRYVRRRQANPQDITMTEADGIVSAGLPLMLVQHFAGEGWTPTAALGHEYGFNAADHAKAVGYPAGAHLWCDLESVAPNSDVIGYCNAWYDEVSAAGFLPGLYVGYGCGLTPSQLYALKFQAYWSSYNLNQDQYPVERGVMMRQHVAKPADFVAGLTNDDMDTDTIGADTKGGTPVLAFA